MVIEQRQRTKRLYTDVTRKPRRYWTVIYTDAKKTVPIAIHFSEKLVSSSKQGFPFECVLSRAIEDFADQNPALFPHPVLHVYVLKRVIYIVTRIEGVPTHAVRYWHDFGRLADTFDRITKKQFLAQFGEEGFKLILRPAKNRGGEELPGARETRRERARERAHEVTPVASHGALGRAIAAGFEIAI